MESYRFLDQRELDIKRRGKQRQIIWIDIETYAKLIPLYLKHKEDNIALNEFISTILRAVVNDKEFIERFERDFEKYTLGSYVKSYQEKEF
jgi:hypothetical protein